MKKYLAGLLVFFLFVIPVFASDTLYEDNSYITVSDFVRVFGGTYVGFPFTATTEDHTITSVKFTLFRYGSDSRTARLSLETMIGGEPDNTEICGYDYNYTSLTTSGSGTVVELPISCSHLVVGTEYVWVWKSQTATVVTTEIDVGEDYPTQAGEASCHTSNDGVVWSCGLNYTGWFQNYGLTYSGGGGGGPVATSTLAGTATTTFESTVGFSPDLVFNWGFQLLTTSIGFLVTTLYTLRNWISAIIIIMLIIGFAFRGLTFFRY